MSQVATLLLSSLLCCTVALSGKEAPPIKVCLVSGSNEYHSDASLAAFKKYLEERTNARCTLIRGRGDLNRFGEFGDLPGLEALEECDVALFFTRRLTIDGQQLERVKKYCEAGRPVVAVRTASHGFQNWLEFDKLVLGGSYQGHFKNGPTQKAAAQPNSKDHPVLDGIGTIMSRASLYKTAPLAPDAQLLMVSSTPENSQPAAWARSYKGARVFYTSLGAPEDFENATFKRLLANAVFWAAGQELKWKELPPPATRPKPEGALHLRLRSRLETFKGSGIWDEVFMEKQIPIAETAIVICDMWDTHWCQGAAARCEALAARMAPVIQAARDRGIQIIHAPSETMDFYADWPQRRRALLAPAASLPEELKLLDPKLPIDDSDGGCDTAEKPWYRAWTRQNARIFIAEGDAITDKGSEVYNFITQHGIKNLIFMGVHTNMCILSRSFAIRQMTRWGVRCILVRDLTDTMYDPKDPPFISHDAGTELVVQHIEKYWSPSILSSELLVPSQLVLPKSP